MDNKNSDSTVVDKNDHNYEDEYDFPKELMNEKQAEDTDNIHLEYELKDGESPRTTRFHIKFPLEAYESLISTYSCAFKDKILLQGKLYLTTKKLCFYSVFNSTNLFFKGATKLSIAYADVNEVEKSYTALFFPNAIKVYTIDGKVYKFCSLLQRNETYDTLQNLIESYSQSSLGVQVEEHEYNKNDLTQKDEIRNVISGESLSQGNINICEFNFYKIYLPLFSNTFLL